MKLSIYMALVVAILLTGCFKNEGEIGIVSNVANAIIYIDGEKKGMTGDSYTTMIIEEGNHKVRIYKEKNEDYYYEGIQDIFIGANTSTKIKINVITFETDLKKKKLVKEKAMKKKKLAKEKAIEKRIELDNMSAFVLTATDGETQYIVKKGTEGFMLDKDDKKIIIFDIFATWCPPCKENLTKLTSLQETFKDNLIVLGLTNENGISNTKLEEFKEEFNGKYEIVNSDENILLINAITENLVLGKRYPIPVVAMYKDGKLITYSVGDLKKETLYSAIKNALDK